MKTVRSPAAIDRASPARLWGWCAFIVVVGIAARVVWFVQFEHELPFGFGIVGSPGTGHAWALYSNYPYGAGNSFDLTRAFAPAYGGMLRALRELAGGMSGSAHAMSVNLLVVQSGLVAFTTLLTFSLSRRVLFGYAALVPAILITLSIALIELPGGLAPQIPLMFLITLAIWLITILRERLPDYTGPRAVALTVGAGFTIGLAILFNPTVLLLAPFVIWWAFRGLGTDHATLLLVAIILLPASWLAVIQTQTADGIPTGQAESWVNKDSGNLPSSADELADRVYSIATPWTSRFARGSYSSTNWNYEWIVPKSVRADTTFEAATGGVVAFAILVAVALILLGVTALFAEGAGSSARLLGLPVLTMPFATLLSPDGNVLRIAALPFLMIALMLGWAWLLENLRPYIRERRAPKPVEWT